MPFDSRSFSFSNTGLVDDPYPVYAEIREQDPIHHSRMYGGSWILFSYKDAAALARDPRLTNNRATLPIMALPEHQRGEFDDPAGRPVRNDSRCIGGTVPAPCRSPSR